MLMPDEPTFPYASKPTLELAAIHPLIREGAHKRTKLADPRIP